MCKGGVCVNVSVCVCVSVCICVECVCGVCVESVECVVCVWSVCVCLCLWGDGTWSWRSPTDVGSNIRVVPGNTHRGEGSGTVVTVGHAHRV
mgnify:CR=1 FL=1